MSEIFKIGIAKNNNQEIQEVNEINLIAGKGIIGDRNFYEHNDSSHGDPYKDGRKQLTLIESENIDYYNKKFNLKIPYLNFRRNIVTKGIKLNNLLDKELLINQTKIKGVDLCRPCKELQEKLGLDNYIKEFLRKGGLRCEILSSGKISINDKITLT